MSGPPVVIVPSLGRPVVNVPRANGGVPMTVVSSLGEPVTLTTGLGEPVTLLNESGSLYAAPWTVSGLASWYDPSDLTSLYQSRTGGSNVSADGQSVGIMLDKSQMGGRTASAFVAGQTELVTNGSFATDTAWTKGTGWTISGGQAVATAIINDSAQRLYQAISTVAGTLYRITYTIAGFSGNGMSLFTGAADPPLTAGVFVNANGTYTEMFTAVGSTTFVGFGARGSGTTTFIIDNVSVKALPGYHAIAPSDAARPLYKTSGGKHWLQPDGIDDWMQVSPVLNLGETWWHVGGWLCSTSGRAAFATTEVSRGALSMGSSATLYRWADAAGNSQPISNSATLSAAHVGTVQQTSTSLIFARINGVSGPSITPFDDSASVQGLALFTGINTAWANGLSGRSYPGVYGTGTLSDSDRASLEAYFAEQAGVVL